MHQGITKCGFPRTFENSRSSPRTKPNSMLFRFALLALLCPAASLQVGRLSARAVRPAVASPLRFVRMETPPPPPSGRLGATVDQDGKSNVWAVEPRMKVDNSNENKGIMAFAPVIGVAALSALLIPLLPVPFRVSARRRHSRRATPPTCNCQRAGGASRPRPPAALAFWRSRANGVSANACPPLTLAPWHSQILFAANPDQA